MPRPDDLAKTAQGKNTASSGNPGERLLYPAIVVPGGTNDPTEQNRIRARIVAIDDKTGKIIGKTSDQDDNYNAYSGKDREIPDDRLPICLPLMPEIVHFRPQVGEMVWVILSNPKDITATRYWIGPVITSQLSLNFQAYEGAYRIMEQSDFLQNKQVQNDERSFSVFPTEADVALQGRNDADVILKNREALLIAGKFDKQRYQANNETPSYLRLKQYERLKTFSNVPTGQPRVQPKSIPNSSIKITISRANSGDYNAVVEVIGLDYQLQETEQLSVTTYINSSKNELIDIVKAKIKDYQSKFPKWRLDYTNIPELDSLPKQYPPSQTPNERNLLVPDDNLLPRFSQGNLISTNVNIYSPRGKFRKNATNQYEINEDLKSFGELANTLHPVVFGDDLIALLDLLIRIILTHVHHPQTPLLSTDLSKELAKYTIDGRLQEIISNHIRVN